VVLQDVSLDSKDISLSNVISSKVYTPNNVVNKIAGNDMSKRRYELRHERKLARIQGRSERVVTRAESRNYAYSQGINPFAEGVNAAGGAISNIIGSSRASKENMYYGQLNSAIAGGSGSSASMLLILFIGVIMIFKR
jgi:hypothetical protein